MNSDDIVERLGHITADDEQCRCLKCEAADEIKRLRAAGDALASFVGVWFETHHTDEPSYLVAAWQEARNEQ